MLLAVIHDSIRLRVGTVQNSLEAVNPYKGPPSPAVEAAWDSLFDRTLSLYRPEKGL
jgi:hypothetical protein